MKLDEIYFWILFLLSVFLFIYAACNVPTEVLLTLKGTA